MSVMQAYLEAKRQQQEANERLAKLEANTALVQLLEFQQKLQSLMEEYNQKPQDVASILGINTASKATVSEHRRAERALRVYINPHTGARVETKGGNHKILKVWREEFGRGAVDSWLQASTQQ